MSGNCRIKITTIQIAESYSALACLASPKISRVFPVFTWFIGLFFPFSLRVIVCARMSRVAIPVEFEQSLPAWLCRWDRLDNFHGICHAQSVMTTAFAVMLSSGFGVSGRLPCLPCSLGTMGLKPDLSISCSGGEGAIQRTSLSLPLTTQQGFIPPVKIQNQFYVDSSLPRNEMSTKYSVQKMSSAEKSLPDNNRRAQ